MTHTATTDADVTLRAGNAELTVEPHRGARLASLKVSGTELLRQGNRYGSFVMVPWCGRTDQGRFRSGGELYQLPLDSGPHAIHGTVREGAWQRPGRTSVGGLHHYELSDPWPWEGQVTQVVELAESGRAHAHAGRGAAPTPASPRRPAGTPGSCATSAAAAATCTSTSRPSGRRSAASTTSRPASGSPRPGPWDDCFGMPQGVDVTLTWPGKLELKVASRAEWVVVYDEQPEAVCVEPQTGPPNGLNTHPHLVTPIQPLEISTTWTWRTL